MMSKVLFNNKQQETLRNNKYVKSVSEKGITYTDDFKAHAISESLSGKTSTQIFEEAGFDLTAMGGRPHNALYRWKKAFKVNGEMGLRDTRKDYSGRPLERTLTSDEIIARKDAEIEYLKIELNLVKKLDLIERRRLRTKNQNSSKLLNYEKFKLIKDLYKKFKSKISIAYLCQLAFVSRSGYYNYFSEKSFSSRIKRNEQDAKNIRIVKEIINYKGFKKGSRTIKMLLLTKKNIIWSRKKIQRLMRKYNIVCPIRKSNPYRKMAKAIKENNYASNLLNREFNPGEAHRVLLTDITYIYYGSNRKLAYLSAIKDSETKVIEAHNISKSLEMPLVTETLKKLMNNSNFEVNEKTILHSDQGCHYTSHLYRKILEDHSITRSMSRRGNCWDNAPMESFFGLLKQETYFKDIETYEELIEYIDKFMYYYNYERPQWDLKKTTPIDYRNCLLTNAS